MPNFYNTNKETGSLLSKSRKKAETQDAKVLALFKRYPSKGYTAWDVYLNLRGYRSPSSSFRRACTTLCDDGKIVETGEFKKGGFGKNNRVYKYRKS